MTSPGLRERKKDRTRATITRAALELFARDGFHATTIPAIAEAADVAPRTVSTYFPSKEGIVFEAYEEAIERFGERLADPDRTEPVHELMRQWLLNEQDEQENPMRGVVSARDEDEDVDFARLREAAIAADPDLWALQRRHLLPLTRLVADGVAEDQGLEPDSLEAEVVAETMVAILAAINARAARTGTSMMDEYDAALSFLRAGLAGAES